MAANATVHKVELSISDMDRHYYASHALTLAQHPSETPERLMVRLLGFMLFADERLAFGRGAVEDEADLWLRDDVGDIQRWIEVGLPDPARVKRASGRSREVVVLTYGGRAAELWWDKHAAELRKIRRVRVLEVPAAVSEALAALPGRSMRLQVLVQDGVLQVLDEAGGSLDVIATERLALTAG
jgi:uncharacterized protein YaeQ